jgi:hypothetical protein
VSAFNLCCKSETSTHRQLRRPTVSPRFSSIRHSRGRGSSTST